MPNTFSGQGSLSGVGTLSAPETVYALGDTGPGGGKIFYDAGSVQSWGRYMEVATNLCSPAWTADTQVPWGGSAVLSGTATAIGTGLSNTNNIILSPGGSATYAANRCRNFTGGGKTDWFMGSKDEMYQLYLNKASVGDIPAFGLYYFTSSEFTASLAWGQFMSNGTQNQYQPKSDSNANRHRPIRYV